MKTVIRVDIYVCKCVNNGGPGSYCICSPPGAHLIEELRRRGLPTFLFERLRTVSPVMYMCIVY